MIKLENMEGDAGDVKHTYSTQVNTWEITV